MTSEVTPHHLPLDEPEDRSLVKLGDKNKRPDVLLRFDTDNEAPAREPIKKAPSNFDVLNTDPKVETVRKQVSVLKIENHNQKRRRRCIIQ